MCSPLHLCQCFILLAFALMALKNVHNTNSSVLELTEFYATKIDLFLIDNQYIYSIYCYLIIRFYSELRDTLKLMFKN